MIITEMTMAALRRSRPCELRQHSVLSNARLEFSNYPTKERNTMDKPKILIVDDDPDLRRGLNLRLRASHFDTAYATDGFSAIAMAQKERPDLIILDIGLPAGDGFVVLDRLQQSAHSPPSQSSS